MESSKLEISDIAIGATSLEAAKTHSDRGWWHMPPCISYTENPQECYYRTLEANSTGIEIIGQKAPLENTSAIFMVPIYYEEWRQGNIQAQLFELLCRDYADNADNIEITYLLNELSEDRTKPEEQLILDFVAKFPMKTNPLKRQDYDWRPAIVPDYSAMTRDQFKEYQELRLGKRLPYPDYLIANPKYSNEECKKRGESIISDNQKIISLFTDIALIQTLGRIDSYSSPEQYSRIQQHAISIIEKYNSDPELQEVVKLSFANAKHVTISLINLLNTDFAGEGYQDKGIASVRTIGMDYARLRYGEKANIIAQPLDADEVPSHSYVHNMREYYQRSELECTQVPIATILIPGLSKQLSETGLDASLSNTGVTNFPPMTTRCQSITLGLVAEINGVSGEPLGSLDRDEDYYLARRMERFATITGGVKYRQLHELPPVAVCMIDRPGWVDGYNRITESIKDNGLPAESLNKELCNDKYQSFLDPEKYQQWCLQFIALNEGVNNLPTFPLYEQISLKYTEYINKYFNDIYLPQNQRNRDLFRILCNIRNSFSIDASTNKITISNWEEVPEEDRFDVAHFLNHNSKLVISMTEDDWRYSEYLLDQSGSVEPTCPTTNFQVALREYIGVPEIPENVIRRNFAISRTNSSDSPDKKTYSFSALAFKLAYDLCIENFFRLKIDRDGGKPSTTHTTPQCYDSFEIRSSGLSHIMISNQNQ